MARTHCSQHHHLQHAAKHSGEMLGDPEKPGESKDQHPPSDVQESGIWDLLRASLKCLKRT